MPEAKIAVILPAAGNSTRFGNSRRKKVYVDLRGRPVWLRAVEHFINRDDVAQVLVVVSPDDLTWFREQYAANVTLLGIEIVAGGAERADSVRNALARVRDEVEFVAVHDAARPLLAKEWIDRVFAAARSEGGAILATPVTQTLKRGTAAGVVETTVSRERLWAAQTPQVFRKEWLIDAYARCGTEPTTDEAQLIERAGRPVRLVECPALNIKITTQEDLKLAEAALDALPKPQGLRALHPFADDELFR